MTYSMKIKGKQITGSTLKEMSDAYSKARDASGQGASRFPEANIMGEDGEPVARISYNGRVWPAGEWTPDQTPLYDNRI